MKEINSFAKKLNDRLKAEGFTVQYYHARNTNSVYLKLDYGMGHSIRVSDHKGKSHLHYRYNFLLFSNKLKKLNSGREVRYFSPFHELDRMVKIIKSDKEALIRKIGLNKYEEGMRLQYVINEGRPGFWANYKFI